MLANIQFFCIPTWFRRGQILGWIQPADAKEIAQLLSFSHISPSKEDTIEASLELERSLTKQRYL